MYRYENHPMIEYEENLDFIPLLDTGFFFHIRNPYNVVTKAKVMMALYI